MKVSVIVPTYNQEKFISQCLDGALSQETDFEYEILIGEDGSTDSTKSICEEYVRKYPDKIKLFSTKPEEKYYVNGRPSGRMNLINLLKSSRGEYIAICEGDDYWTDKKKLQKQADILDARKDAAICFHNMTMIYEDGSAPSRLTNQNQKTISSVFDLAMTNFIFTASCMFRNQFWKSFPEYFIKSPIGDYPLHLMNAQHGSIYYIDEPMGVYRVHKGGLWESKTWIYRYQAWVDLQDSLIGNFTDKLDYLFRFSQIFYCLKLAEQFLTENNHEDYKKYYLKALRNECLIIDYPGFENRKQTVISAFDGATEELKRDKEYIYLREEFLNKIKRVSVSIDDKLMEAGSNKDAKASIIILTYNSEKTLPALLHSLEYSIRPGDEVIIVDNNSNEGTSRIINKFLKTNYNFRFIQNKTNLGFSAGSNVGIKAAINPFIILLNPDTIVTKNWIPRLLAHFDNDKIAAVGPVSNYVAGLQRMDLYLKKLPENLDMDGIGDFVYNAFNGKSIETKLLIGFCIALRKSVIDKLGHLDEDLFLGNDDLELSWRLRLNGYTLKVALDVFIYHEGQHSFNTESKSTTSKLVQESSDALYEKLKKHYGKGNVPPPEALWGIDWFKPTVCEFNQTAKLNSAPASNGVKRKIPQNDKVVSIIILTYNQLEYTKQCIDSIRNRIKTNYELIIIDNASSDKTIEYLRNITLDDKRIKIIENKYNIGFPKGVNQGLKNASGSYVLIANNDIVVTDNLLERLIEVAESDEKIGIVGPISNMVSGFQIDKSANYKNLTEMYKHAENLRIRNQGQMLNFPRIAFLFALIKKEVIEKIGGLDERFTPGNYEDDDFCLRAQKAGFKTVIVKDAFVHHFGSKSFTAEGVEKYKNRLLANQKIFVEKWGATPDEIWIANKKNKERELFIPLNKDEIYESYLRASILAKEEDYQWAYESLKTAFSVLDTQKSINVKIEDVYNLAGEIKAAALSEHEKDFTFEFNEGYRHFINKEFEEAIEKFTFCETGIIKGYFVSSIVSLDDLYVLKGASNLSLKNYEAAKEEFMKAINLNSNSSKAYEGLGEAYYGLNEFMKAKEAFNNALELGGGENAKLKLKLIEDK